MKIICHRSLRGVTLFPRYNKLTLMIHVVVRVSVLFAVSREFPLKGNATEEIPVHVYTATKLTCIAYVTVQMDRPPLVLQVAVVVPSMR